MSGIDVMFGFDPPAGAGSPDLGVKQVYTTAYIVRLAAEDVSPAAVPLLDDRGTPVGVAVSHADYCNGAVEGTIWVERKSEEPIRFNFAKLIAKRSADCSDVFRRVAKENPAKVANWGRVSFGPIRSSAPFGTGAGTARTACATAARAATFRLIPHRSIAVDPDVIGIGSLVYLPQLAGTKITLPDGQEFRHDGFLLAVDTGSSIRGNHIDYFMGPSKSDNILPEIAASPKQPIPLDVVDDAGVLASLCSLHANR